MILNLKLLYNGKSKGFLSCYVKNDSTKRRLLQSIVSIVEVFYKNEKEKNNIKWNKTLFIRYDCPNVLKRLYENGWNLKKKHLYVLKNVM